MCPDMLGKVGGVHEEALVILDFFLITLNT